MVKQIGDKIKFFSLCGYSTGIITEFIKSDKLIVIDDYNISHLININQIIKKQNLNLFFLPLFLWQLKYYK